MTKPRVKNQQNSSVKELGSLLKKTLDLREHHELKSLSDNILKTVLNEESSHTSVANKINELLSKKSSRILGLELLNLCLPYFTLRDFNSYAPGWIRYCLDCHDCDSDKHLKTLTNIIRHSQNHDQFNKIFVSEFLTPTLLFLMNKSTNLIISEVSLDCLIVCLKQYSSSCNAHKNKINEYILTYLSSTSDIHVSLAGTAFFQAQHIGNAGKDGENHRDSVTLSIRKLCATCHDLFNLIFEDQVEFECFNFNDVQSYNVKLEPPTEQNVRNINKLQYRTQILKNCLQWIRCFLGRSTMKTVYPKELLGVIQRGMSVHLCQENYESIDKFYFSEFLIEVQLDCIKTLKSLISHMGLLLAPFHYTITQTIVDTVERSSTCKCYNEDMFQEHLHGVFLLWLQTGRCKLDLDVCEKLVSSLLLTAFSHSETLEDESSKDFVYNSKICFNALKTLHILMENIQLPLTPVLGKKLLASVISTILSVQKGSIIFPNEAYEVILYKIICLIIENDITPLLPIHIVLQLLHNGCQNVNPNISSVCYKSLNSLEKICHPIFSSLNIAKDVKLGEFGDGVEKNSMEVDV